jgi:ParB family transcriptional regulator, chromosome partitioning protein
MKPEQPDIMQITLFEQESLSHKDDNSHSSSHKGGKAMQYRKNEVYLVSCAEIRENPMHPRVTVNKDSLTMLAASIKKKGLLQPLVCTVNNAGELQLACGYRRLVAAKMAGLEKVLVIVVDGRQTELSLIENMHREDLTVVEEAEGVNDLKHECGYKLEQLKMLLGKGISTISEILAVAKLPEVIRNDCRSNRDIPRDVLVLISRVESDEEKIRLYEEVKAERLTRDDLKRQSSHSNTGTREIYSFIISFSVKLSRLKVDKIALSDRALVIKELEQTYIEIEKQLGELNSLP